MTTSTDGSAIPGFPAKRTADIVGISYRQLDYWARTGVLRPSLVEATGSGSRRQYSYSDLLELKIIKGLRDAGISLKKISSIFQYVRHELDEDVTAARLVIDGSNVVFARGDAELIDVLQRGQGVLNVLPLSNVRRDVDAAIVELRPTDRGDDQYDEDDDLDGAEDDGSGHGDVSWAATGGR